jgi:hypothetical protein
VHSPTFNRTAVNIALQLELQEGAIWLMLSETAVIVSHDNFGELSKVNNCINLLNIHTDDTHYMYYDKVEVSNDDQFLIDRPTIRRGG